MQTDIRSNHHTQSDQSQSASKQPHRHIVVAEDDSEMRSLIALSLQAEGFEVVECRHGIELVDHLKQFSDSGDESVDLIISDIRMSGISGLAVLEGLAKERDPPPMILITAFGDSDTHAEAKRLGAAAILDKPFPVEDLLKAVRDIIPP